MKLELSKNQGLILDFLEKHDLLDVKLEKSIFLFFRSCINDDDLFSSNGEEYVETDEDQDYANYSRYV